MAAEEWLPGSQQSQRDLDPTRNLIPMQWARKEKKYLTPPTFQSPVLPPWMELERKAKEIVQSVVSALRHRAGQRKSDSEMETHYNGEEPANPGM